MICTAPVTAAWSQDWQLTVPATGLTLEVGLRVEMKGKTWTHNDWEETDKVLWGRTTWDVDSAEANLTGEHTDVNLTLLTDDDEHTFNAWLRTFIDDVQPTEWNVHFDDQEIVTRQEWES